MGAIVVSYRTSWFEEIEFWNYRPFFDESTVSMVTGMPPQLLLTYCLEIFSPLCKSEVTTLSAAEIFDITLLCKSEKSFIMLGKC